MAAISASLVKELRERTSVGMMDCKKALEECNGDIEAAIDLLRSKGLSKAAKKAGRATSEGVVAQQASADNRIVALVEVKCETDFVSRGDQFQAFGKSVVEKVYNNAPADAAALEALVGDELNNQIATLGENMSIGRFCRMEVQGNGIVGCYVHTNGKIGVLVELSCTKPETAQKPEFLELARNLAMQVTAAGAVALEASSVDPALVEREREVFRQKTLDEGKPANIVEKIVEGRIQKFYQEICLLEQAYIRDDKLTIKALLKEQSKAFGDEITVARFVRLQLGEQAE